MLKCFSDHYQYLGEKMHEKKSPKTVILGEKGGRAVGGRKGLD